jgi:hypothetical protein
MISMSMVLNYVFCSKPNLERLDFKICVELVGGGGGLGVGGGRGGGW